MSELKLVENQMVVKRRNIITCVICGKQTAQEVSSECKICLCKRREFKCSSCNTVFTNDDQGDYNEREELAATYRLLQS